MGGALRRDSLGFGLRPHHVTWLVEHGVGVDYLEVVTENVLSDAEAPRRRLARLRAQVPIVLHGVGLNLLGPEPIDEAYLDRVRDLASEVDAAFVTDHLCWTRSRARSHHDLLPVPHVPELVELAAERAAYVQARLGRPFGVENLSSYVAFERSTMSEAAFVAAVAERADCGLLLDVNNIVVSAHNHGFDAASYLEAVDFDRVLEVHVAGHSATPDGGLVDSHDHAPQDSVWALYAAAWRRGGPFPTLLEWDDLLPPVPDLVAVLERARQVRS